MADIETRVMIRAVLWHIYTSEFEVIDGYSRHPSLLNFKKWTVEVIGESLHIDTEEEPDGVERRE